MITKHTVPVTIERVEYRADCELCPATAGTFTEEEFAALEADKRDPVISVTFDGHTTHLTDLCDNCAAFVRDGLDSLLKPITRARRYTGASEPAGDAPTPETQDASEPPDASEAQGEAGGADDPFVPPVEE